MQGLLTLFRPWDISWLLNSHRRACPKLLRFISPSFRLFYLVACNATKTISLESLVDTPAGGTSHFLFPTSGSNAEAYLTRPAGPGPFPLMILLHGHTLGSIGAESIVPAAEAFASDLCYAGLAVSLPGYGATEVPPGTDPKTTLDVVLTQLPRQEPPVDRFEAILPLRLLGRGAFFTALLANRIEGIEGMVLHSGAYDGIRLYQETPWLRSVLNPSGEENPKLISILPEVSTWYAPHLVCMAQKDSLWFPSNRRISYATPWRPPRNPTASFSIPIMVIASLPRTLEKKAIAFFEENSGSACRTGAP